MTVLDPTPRRRLCLSVCAVQRGGAFTRGVVPRRPGAALADYFPLLLAGAPLPNIKSAKKDLRKSRAAAIRNRAQRSALRTAVKKAKADGSAAAEQLSAVSLLDRAARKGLIHRNTAARQKSKIAKPRAA